MICNLDKKRGGIRRLDAESEHFQALIDKLGLIDLETQNGLYTWSNRRSGSQQVACRLDRFLISNSLLMDGSALEASILNAPESYHWTIQLWLDILGSPGRKPFRFERFWLIHPDFQTMAPIWWKEANIPFGSKMLCFQQRLKNFKQRLKLWNKKTFGNIFEAQQQLNEQMQLLQIQIRNQGITEELGGQEALISQKLDERRVQEEILWRQKSRVQWLQEGDRNTKFLHRSMIQRRHVNRISHIVTEEGQTLHSHNDLEELVSFYQDLFLNLGAIDLMPLLKSLSTSHPKLLKRRMKHR
jgi:hypothetical protein